MVAARGGHVAKSGDTARLEARATSGADAGLRVSVAQASCFTPRLRPLYVGVLNLRAAVRKPLTKALLAWYRRHKRDLPWRHTKDPYRIWLSEVMLQQTRVTTVIPYYESFLERFPTFESLAAASEQSLLEAWSGLGYYRCARQMQAAAREIITDRNGRFPQSYEALRELPGFGNYTAAAVSAIAFGGRHAAVDGNVVRVLARIGDVEGNVSESAVRRELAKAAQLLVESVGPRSAGTWNQAVMELGAIVCTPRSPQCARCPISRWCRARRAGTQLIRPVKNRPRKSERVEISAIVCEKEGRLLMKQRSADAARMPGFWELPEIEGRLLRETDLADWGMGHAEKLCKFSHGITFRTYEVNVYRAILVGTKPKLFHWVSRKRLSTMPITTVARKALGIVGEALVS